MIFVSLPWPLARRFEETRWYVSRRMSKAIMPKNEGRSMVIQAVYRHPGGESTIKLQLSMSWLVHAQSQ